MHYLVPPLNWETIAPAYRAWRSPDVMFLIMRYIRKVKQPSQRPEPKSPVHRTHMDIYFLDASDREHYHESGAAER